MWRREGRFTAPIGKGKNRKWSMSRDIAAVPLPAAVLPPPCRKDTYTADGTIGRTAFAGKVP